MPRLDPLLDELGCRALVVAAYTSHDPALAPFAGAGRLGPAFVVAARGRPPRLAYLSPMERGEAALSGLELLTPEQLDVERWTRDGADPETFWARVLSRGLHLCELAPGPLAITGGLPMGTTWGACGRLAEEGWSFVPGESLAARLRKTKDAAAVDEVRRTAAGVAAAFRHVAAVLAAARRRDGELWYDGGRLRVGDLRRRVARVLAEHGLEQPERGILAPAEEGAVPHTTGTAERVLRAGESLVVDLFPRGRLFADCTRTFCVGEPPPALARAHEHVERALALAEERSRPGAGAWSVQEAVCGHFDEHGYPTPITERGTERGYVHGLGHGVGFQLHELPSFREHASEAEARLEAGDVFTLEPGLYEPEEGWAVRLENTYHLGADGLDDLTPLPLELDPARW